MSGPSHAAQLQGALDGLRVLDLTRYIPGPFCTLLLGDLGADVVKVEEPPVGDATRAVPPAPDGESVAHAALNRNKRSILVDLRRDEGVAVVRRLAESADVLVEGFRPGVLERRGLGADALRARNPRLVYCSLSGYGQTGPLAARAGHDVNYAARGGLLALLREADGRPIVPGVQLADMTGGLLAALGILAALQARERSGLGQVVDVSLLHGVLALASVPIARGLAGATRPDELAGTHACYNVYRCRDGRYLSVGALEPKFWEALCRALGHPEKAGRQWEGRAQRDDTRALVAATFATRERDEWLRLLAGADVCVEPVLEPEEALDDPQAAAVAVEWSLGPGRGRGVGFPFRLSATPAATRRPAPGLGEHTREVLASAGYAAREIEALQQSGVVA